MIKIINVKKEYHLGKCRVQALRGINLEIEKGQFITLAGPSGSGKTTLLNLMGLVDEPTDGSVIIDGINTSFFTEKQKAKIRNDLIGFIFQSFNLIPVLNVYENIELPALLKKRRPDKKKLKKWIDHLMQETGLHDVIKRKPDELSGGQRQRAAIARSLVNKPSIVLADEPTANLDSDTGRMIIELMKGINKTEKTTFLFSTHDPQIMSLTERVYIIKDGLLAN